MPKHADPRQQALKAASAAVKSHKKLKNEPVDAGSELLEVPTLWVGTGSLALDRMLRGKNPGGIPVGPRYGRIVHIAGDWSTGKSLMLDHIFKNVIQMGGLAYCSESEATRDPQFASRIGLDLSRVMVHMSTNISTMLDTFLVWHTALRKQMPDIPVVWGIDSLDASRGSKSDSAGMSEGHGWMMGGGKSEELGEALKRFTGNCSSKFPTSLVMLNQTRVNPRVLFGSPKYAPGGNAPHFYASVEVFLSASKLGVVRGKYQGAKLNEAARKRLGLNKTDKGDVIGRWIKARVTKNKTGGPVFEETDFYISFKSGMHPGRGLLARLCLEGICHLDGEKVTHMVNREEGFEFADENQWAQWVVSNPKLALGFHRSQVQEEHE